MMGSKIKIQISLKGVVFKGPNNGSKAQPLRGLQPSRGSSERRVAFRMVMGSNRKSFSFNVPLRFPRLSAPIFSGREVRPQPDYRRSVQGLSVRHRQFIPEHKQGTFC